MEAICERITGVNCQELDKLNGNYEFQKHQWNGVVEKLNTEDNDYAIWKKQSTQQPPDTSSPSPPEPARQIRDSPIKAMEAIDERDFEQMFWEIRLYAARNTKMHSGVLDLRGQARYDELLDVLRHDFQTIGDLLPKNKGKDIKRYRDLVIRYRRKWRDEEEVEGEKLQLNKKEITLNHEMKVVKEAAENASKQSSSSKESMETLKSTLKVISGQIAEQKPLIEDANRKICAIVEAVASATEVNGTPKRVLSSASLEDQDHRRQRLDNEQ